MLLPLSNMRGLKTENQKQDGFLTEVFMDGTNSNIYPICQNNLPEWTRILRENPILFIISQRFRGNN